MICHHFRYRYQEVDSDNDGYDRAQRPGDELKHRCVPRCNAFGRTKNPLRYDDRPMLTANAIKIPRGLDDITYFLKAP